MAKYIVTGGAGFIGSHVTDLLIKRKHKVHVVDDFSSGKEEHLNPAAKLSVLDISEEGAVPLLADLCRGADGVFHLAAIPRMQYSIQEPLRTHDANVNGTLNVLMAARSAGVRRLVYSASSSAYGTFNQPPFREDMPPRPLIPYAVQKYVGELYCRTFGEFYGLETVCLRYFNVYGPRQTTDADGPYATVIGIFLGQRAKGEAMTIVPDGTQRRDFTHVRDVARANLLAMFAAKKIAGGQVFNVGTGVNWSILQVAQMIGGPTRFTDPRRGEAWQTLADITKARRFMDWEPQVSFEDGIAELKELHGID